MYLAKSKFWLCGPFLDFYISKNWESREHREHFSEITTNKQGYYYLHFLFPRHYRICSFRLLRCNCIHTSPLWIKWKPLPKQACVANFPLLMHFKSVGLLFPEFTYNHFWCSRLQMEAVLSASLTLSLQSALGSQEQLFAAFHAWFLCYFYASKEVSVSCREVWCPLGQT